MTGRPPTDHTAARATPPGGLVGRRSLVLGSLLALGGTASACGSADTAAPAADLPSPTPSRRPTPSPSSSAPPPPPPPPAPLLADVPAYALLPGEVVPACKDAAVAFVTAVLTAGTPATASAPLEQRLAALGQPVAAAAPLLDLLPVGGASALEVVYPQYGGLTAERDEASVMLVADQLVVPGGADGAGGAVQRRSTTLDVRLRTEGGAWRVTEVRPAVLPAAAPSLSAPVQALLGTDRVVLPAAARADLLGGGVHDAVATALLELSARWRVHVQVLTGGHPANVWDTDRTSNHTRGRAVDVWALDGVPVVDQAACPWEELVLAGSAAGASEVGGPRSIGVEGSFTDQVHQDHVHLGFGRA